MSGDHTSADGQTKSQPGRGLYRGAPGGVIRRVDPIDHIAFHADAGIAYRDLNEPGRTRGRRDRYGAAGVRKLRRVAKQVPEYLSKSHRIADDRVLRRVERRHDGDASALSLTTQHVDDFLDDLMQVDLLVRELQAAA